MRALVLALLVCCSASPPAMRTAVVRHGDVVDRVLLTGALHPVSAAMVFVPPTDQPTVAIRWLVADGTAVNAGDRVAELDSAPFVGSLKEAQGQLRGWEAQYVLQQRANDTGLASKRYELRRAEIERDKAALRAAVPEDLQLGRAAQESKLALRQAETRLGTARTELASGIEETELDRRIQLINRDRMRRAIANAEQAMAALVLVAPRDGVVVVELRDARKLGVGESVQAGTPIVSMPDLAKPMEVVAELSDVDDGRVEPRMTGTCTLDAYPTEPIACTVETVDPIARAPRGKDSLRRTFGVSLTLAHIDAERLRPGMAFEVELHRPAVHGLVVPRGAVFAGHHVMLGSGEVRVVELGACDAQQCAITRGLDDGDVVAIGGAS